MRCAATTVISCNPPATASARRSRTRTIRNVRCMPRCRMQEELKRYSTRLREAGNLPIEARVGVNAGEVVVRSIATGGGNTEYTPIGHTTNLASRMQALAPTGSIAISEQARKLVEGYFSLKPLGPTKVKGVTEPVNVYEVTGFGPLCTRLQRSAGRGLTKFVGRAREMEALARASEQARSGGGRLPRRDRIRAKDELQNVGTTRDHQPRAPARPAGTSRRCSRDARRHLQLVY